MSAWVHYAEGQGDAARAALHGLLDALPAQPGFLGAELLLSPGQPALTLVASRWAGEVPPLPVPEGVRAWTFQVLDQRQPQ
ncbi:antibiotic biosynthesis monooxygenase family protein [Deinococcus aquaedulcis]|uniref:antibiotic biosynthesis monooxygenase family protein n=1 Tax=Deinococcus aquaedulcis TaxID=2840455 RepID=UPI001C82FA71|nr:antibiotic biosynthesis monooxygenase [Deinococcus aquaedulcis]